MARAEKNYHFIYKTTNQINGKYYVGMHSTDDLNDGYIGSGYKLKRSISKHGIENFKMEILEYLPNRGSLKARESELVNEDLLKDPMCMNLVYGGNGGYISPEGCKKGGIIAGSIIANRIKNDVEYRKIHTLNFIEITKRNWKNGLCKHYDWTGKKHKSETIEKMKQSKIGYGLASTNSQFGTCWITNGIENKKIKKTEKLPEGWELGRKIKN